MTTNNTLSRVLLPLYVMAFWGASAWAQNAGMGKPAYDTDKARIHAEYRVDKKACTSLAGNTKDVCIEEAKAKEKIALAELEAHFTGKAADHNSLQIAKAEAAYAIAKEKCDGQAGNAKDVCIEKAKAIKTKALADVKLKKEVRQSQKDASEDSREADHKVAVEKCDAMAGEAKANCMASAKAKYDPK
jgi:hypothetical protein